MALDLLLAVIVAVVELGLCQSELLKPDVAVLLRLVESLIDLIDLLRERAEELAPVLLLEVAIVVVLNQNLKQFLKLDLGLVPVLIKSLEGELGHVQFYLAGILGRTRQ